MELQIQEQATSEKDEGRKGIEINVIDINDPSLPEEIRRRCKERTKEMLAGGGQYVSLIPRPEILAQIYADQSLPPSQ